MERIRRLEQCIDAVTRGMAQPVWLGGLFAAEAFVTATRQTAAHARGCSLEELRIKVCWRDLSCLVLSRPPREENRHAQ